MAKALPKRSENYSEWYNEIVKRADLAENSAVRGCMVIKPYGFAIWEKMQRALDELQETQRVGRAPAYVERFAGDRRQTALGEQERGQRRCFTNPPLEAFLLVLADIRVRVLPVGEEEEPDGLVVERERQAHFERAPGRLAPGGIAVERCQRNTSGPP